MFERERKREREKNLKHQAPIQSAQIVADKERIHRKLSVRLIVEQKNPKKVGGREGRVC